jgi:hypothetical protein
MNRPVKDVPPSQLDRFYSTENTLLMIREREFDRFGLKTHVRIVETFSYDESTYLLVAPVSTK